MEHISEIWLLMMSAVLEVLMTYQLFHHFFEKKVLPKSKSVWISIGTMAIIAAVSLLEKYHLNTVMLLVILTLYARLLFECKIPYAVFTSMVFVMIGMVAEIGTGFGVSFVFDVNISSSLFEPEYKIIIYLISNALIFLIVRFVIAVVPSVKQKEINKPQLYFIIFPAFAILNEFLLIYLVSRIEVKREIFFFCMLIGIGLIYGGLLLIMVYEQGIQKYVLESELSLAKQKEEINESFYRLQERNLEEVRAVIHDFKKQLLYLQDMYEDNDAEVKEFQRQLMQLLENQIKKQAIDLNNKVLSSILQRTQIYCEQLQIDFQFQCDRYDFGFLTPFDTSVIFDNAIDNAIEACEKMGIDARKVLRITLHEAKHFVLIEVSNSYAGEIREAEGKLLTTKEEKARHGYGVQNIFEAAQRYGGDGLYQYENGIFTLMVRLQIPDR